MKRVLLDCDGVLSDFVGMVLAWDNHQHTRESITDFNIFKCWGQPERWVDFTAYLRGTGAVLGMAPTPDARDIVRGLRAGGHEITVVTSPFQGVPNWMPDRLKWLELHFGFSPRDVCFWDQKHRIAGDVLIDDRAEHIEAFPGRALLVDAPYNQRCGLAGDKHRCKTTFELFSRL